MHLAPTTLALCPDGLTTRLDDQTSRLLVIGGLILPTERVMVEVIEVGKGIAGEGMEDAVVVAVGEERARLKWLWPGRAQSSQRFSHNYQA